MGPGTSPVNPELEAYKRHVQEKLAFLNPIFANAAIGDFSKDIEMSHEEDEFTEFYTGIQLMIEVIRQKLAELETLNKQLSEKVDESQRVNQVLIGRELKMVELKNEVNKLRLALGQPPVDSK